jgi:hypothetical protein
MVFATIHRSLWTRLLAAFIVVLVVSPYSEPFATMDGTDFGGAGAVDVGPTSKLKTSSQDALVAPPVVAIVVAALTSDDRPLPSPVIPDPRGNQRAVLRL